MRKVTVTKPTSTNAGLQLPLDFVSGQLRVPTANLLSLDQPTAEYVFSTLFSKLNLNHVRDLVASRVEQRKDGQMASKIGHTPNSSTTSAHKQEEDAYRQVFTTLILSQANKLGFKGVVNPALTSLVADKKLALRLIDHLAKRAYGTPVAAQQQQVDSARSPGVARRPPPSTQQQSIEPASYVTPSPAAASSRSTVRAPSSSQRTEHSHAASASASTMQRHARPPAASPSQPLYDDHDGEDSYAHEQFDSPAPREDRSSSQPKRRRERDEVQEEEYNHIHTPHDTIDDPVDPSSDLDDEPDPRSHRGGGCASSRSKPFDGRFAEEEFQPPPSAAGSSSRRLATGRSGRGSNAATSSSSMNSKPRTSKPKRNVPEEDMSAEELRVLLQEERSRHRETALELQSITSLYSQLLRSAEASNASSNGLGPSAAVAGGGEKFQARRVTLLKAQNMQLERQLSLVSNSVESKRQALTELGTIVVGLEEVVRNDALPASNDSQSSNTQSQQHLNRSARRLAYLDQSLTAARERMSKYSKCSLQYSPAEESFLAQQGQTPGDKATVVPTDSIYSGSVSHLDLTKVHSLESRLSEVYESLLKTHSLLSGISALAPMQYSLREFLSRGPSSHGSSSVSAALRLQSLLDLLRQSASALQSLGVYLPSSTNFLSSTHHQRDWSWIEHLAQALKRKNIPQAQIDAILSRARLEESNSHISQAMYESELQYHRKLQAALVQTVQRFMNHTEGIVAKFHTQNNALFGEATRELNQVMDDWSRNSHSINVQRLLTTLQSIFPAVKQLLEENHRIDVPSSTVIGLPDVASQLQHDLDATLQDFRARMEELQQQQSEIQQEIEQEQSADKSPTTNQGQYITTTAHSRHDDTHATDRQQHLRSSSGRNTNRSQEELPPFQF